MTAIQPSEMTRELKLKLALASLLPDDIEVTDLANFRWLRGRFAGTMVDDTEWDDVLRMIRNQRSSWQHRAMDLLGDYGIEVE